MMLELTLRRLEETQDGTFGEFLDEDGKHICYSVERRSTGDHPCIPKDKYQVVFYNSPTKGPVYLLKDVPNRNMIEIHSANLASELLGCIAPGIAFGDFNGVKGVTSSRTALGELKLAANWPAEWWINII